LKKDICQEFSKEYLYLSAVEYINNVKTGPFHEHSSVLTSITNVESWEKISSGMIKMFKGEVFEKFVVVQHLLFGHTIKWKLIE
jgi:serine/threonine-protein phosphatase 2A activator